MATFTGSRQRNRRPRPEPEPRVRVTRPCRRFAQTVKSANITNSGNAETHPTIKIVGPSAASWWVRNATQSKTIYGSFAVASGSTLVLNTQTHTQTIGGTTVAYLNVELTEWWSLSTGVNAISSTHAAKVIHNNAFE